MTAMTATKIYVAQYHYILMTGRQTFFTGRHKCRPFTMLKILWYRGRSRSLKVPPFNRSYTTFYGSAIVSIALCCTIFKLFDVLVLAATKAEKDLSGTDMYLHAKFHADR